MPIAAATQSVAAVVSPRTERPWRMIAPAPRKPMPVTICAAIRVGSARMTWSPLSRKPRKPYAETIVNSAEPTQTRMCVRSPASRSRSSRSKPIAPPSPAATASRARLSAHVRCGSTLSKRSLEGAELRLRDLVDPDGRELEQLVEQRARERIALRRRLHLDEPAVAGHHDVHVDLRRRVLRVVDVEQRRSVDDCHRHRGDRAGQSLAEPEPLERAARRDVRAGNRGAARAAVGLQDVAVEVDRPLPQRLEIGDGADRAADQPLDLDRAPALPSPARLALGSLARGGREERILRGHPAAAGIAQPAWHALLDRRRAQHLRLSLRPEHAAVRLFQVVDDDLEQAQFVRAATVGPHATTSRSESATCSTSPIGSCRKRVPTTRNDSGSPVVRNRYAPSRDASFSIPLRASVSATSRAVSSAEKTSVTSRPKTRWKIGRISG